MNNYEIKQSGWVVYKDGAPVHCAATQDAAVQWWADNVDV